MRIVNLIRKTFKYAVVILNSYNLLNWLPDRWVLQILYRAHMGKKLNLSNPVYFSEKLQWLKLYNRKKEYSSMVDKYEVKKYVASILGEKYIIPTLGVWNSFDEIDFDTLPNQFVLKTTHDSGGIVICKSKEDFDYRAAEEKINRCLGRNYYFRNREWPYKHVHPQVMAECYMEQEDGTDLTDYKIFNIYGEPQLIQLDYNRFLKHGRSLYSIAWEKIDVTYKYSDERDRIDIKPIQLEELMCCAQKLSKDIPFVRTDFYIIKNQVYFGELTFFPEGGFTEFSDEEFSKRLASLIKLP